MDRSQYSGHDYFIVYSLDAGQRLELELEVFKAGSGESVTKKSFFIGSQSRYPFLSHSVVRNLNDFFGYDSVEWMNEYIIFSKYTGKGKADIYIADYTLTYQKRIVSGGLNIFPKWASENKEAFYYTSYNNRLPTLYRVDLFTGKREKIMESEGMLVCSDTRKQGRELLISKAHNDQPELFLYNIDTKRSKRLTYYSGVDVNGQFAGENSIAFVSDRLGYPNIYKKTLGESSVKQLVFHGKDNNALSAKGKYLVYTSRDSQNSFSSNSFNLYLISLDSSYIRPLTATGKNQYPRLSKSGDTVMFIKTYENESAIGIIRLGQNRSFLFPLEGQKLQSIDW
jgi:TolB protein